MPNKHPLTKQLAHSENCDASNTGRYTAGCDGCLADAMEARQRLEDLDRQTAKPTRTKIRSKRMQAVDRATRLIEVLEEHCSDAAKDGNEVLHADLAVILSALYAANIPTKEGYLRIELELAGDRPRGRREGFFATRRPRPVTLTAQEREAYEQNEAEMGEL